MHDAVQRLMGDIVVIDDDPDDLRLLQRQLVKAGLSHRIHTFSSAREALQSFRGTPAAVSAVFCDLKMPGMSGFEFLGVARLEPAFARAVVLIVSGCALEADVERARALGADGYLEKMPSPETLVQAITHPSFPVTGTRQQLYRSWESARIPAACTTQREERLSSPANHVLQREPSGCCS
jgi:CheY-like chemotaxis protein